MKSILIGLVDRLDVMYVTRWATRIKTNDTISSVAAASYIQTYSANEGGDCKIRDETDLAVEAIQCVFSSPQAE